MLLKYKANINKVGDGLTALHAAAYNSDIDTLKLFLQHNADPNFIDRRWINTFIHSDIHEVLNNS